MTLVALAGAVTRWILLAAVLVSTGAAAFRFLVLRRVAPAGGPEHVAPARRAAAAGMWATLLAAAAALVRLPIQIAEVRDPELALAPQAQALLLHTLWGQVWFAQVVVALIAAGAYGLARKGGRTSWVLAATAAVLLAGTPALSGHAIGSDRLAALAVITDVLHVLGAGAWLGAMLVLFAGLVVQQRSGDTPLAGALVSSFSPLAVAAAMLVAATGVVSSWLHLGAFAPLWQSRYGLVLLVKLGAVGGMGLLGLYNWRRAGPALRLSGDSGPMRRSIRAELVVGALVLAVTAVLVATPAPGSE